MACACPIAGGRASPRLSIQAVPSLCSEKLQLMSWEEDSGSQGSLTDAAVALELGWLSRFFCPSGLISAFYLRSFACLTNPVVGWCGVWGSPKAMASLLGCSSMKQAVPWCTGCQQSSAEMFPLVLNSLGRDLERVLLGRGHRAVWCQAALPDPCRAPSAVPRLQPLVWITAPCSIAPAWLFSTSSPQSRAVLADHPKMWWIEQRIVAL